MSYFKIVDLGVVHGAVLELLSMLALMTQFEETGRRRGNIRQRGSSLQVRFFAGKDPVTGRDVYLTASVPGTDRKAHKRAEDKLAAFRTQVNKQRSTSSLVKLGYAIDEWIRTSEHEDSTREGYRGYIDRTIRPVLGDVPVNKLTARMLETFYAELRRCRIRCDGRPFIEHKVAGEHDCKAAKCKPHECKPMAASTVRQIHSIISGTLNAAVRWDWVSTNPTKAAQRPKQKPPQPDPPSPAVAARLVEAAFEMDDDWGTLVWLVMTKRGSDVARFARCGGRALTLTKASSKSGVATRSGTTWAR
jgi:integrase